MTITFVNIEFYWPMVIAGSVFPMNFKFFLCQFVAILISLLVVQPCSRWFKLVLDGSCLFQVVPARSRWLQLVPSRSSF